MDSTTVRTELLARLELWWDAYNKGDVRTVADLFMDNCILFPQGVTPIVGRQAVFEHLEKKRAASTGDPLDVELAEAEPLGPDTAFTSTKGRMDTTNITSILIWKKIDGVWLIYRDMYNTH